MDDAFKLKQKYREFLQELGVPFQKRDEISDLEWKIIAEGDKVKANLEKWSSLSTDLQGYFRDIGVEPPKEVEPKSYKSIAEIKRLDAMDEFGFKIGSRKSYAAKTLRDGNWWSRKDLLERVKRKLGGCSIFTIDAMETSLRKKGFPLEAKHVGDTVYIRLREED